jgi:hypothetical protein
VHFVFSVLASPVNGDTFTPTVGERIGLFYLVAFFVLKRAVKAVAG